MGRHGCRLSVVLVPQESPNDHEGGSPIASGIHVALRNTRGNVPAYPVIDSISCDGGLAHGRCRRFSASRSAPFSKRATICLGSGQLCSRTARTFRSGAPMGSSVAAYFANRCSAKAHSRSGSRWPCFANSIISLATSCVADRCDLAMSSGPNE
jgi:hypothetical protein